MQTTTYDTILDIQHIKTIIATCEAEPLYLTTANAFQSANIDTLTVDHKVIEKSNHIFSNTIADGKDDETDPINQNHAGVCWICSGMTLCRSHIIKKLGLKKSFNLSINHLLFWHKLEKCNKFMNYIIDNRNKNISKYDIQENLSSPCSDGGHWFTFVDLIKKYGIIPETVCKRRYSGRNTSAVNSLLKYKMREFASLIMSPNGEIIKPTTIDEILSLKNIFIEQITKILIKTIGTPMYPDTQFDWIYKKSGSLKKQIVTIMTPIKFYTTYFDIDIDNYVTIINDPRPRHPYDKLYARHVTTDIALDEKKGIIAKNRLMLNLTNDDIIDLVIKQIDSKMAIWFACDVGQYTNHKYNIMDTQLYDYSSPFETSFTKMSKADRLDFCDSTPCHAMTITGYDKECDKPLSRPRKRKLVDETSLTNKIIKFKVENSWGDVGDNDGIYTMSVDWFKLFSFEVIIHKKFLSREQLNILSTKPTLYKETDPFSKYCEHE